jgi:hypothetical protein
MEYTTDALSIAQKAYSIIDSLKRCIPASSQVYLFDHGKKYFEAAGPAIPIEYKYGPSDFESLFSQMENRKKDSDNSVLLLFSDFQEPLSTELDSIYSRLSPDYSIVCVTMSPASPWNYSVAEPELRNDNGDVVSVKIQASGKPLKNGELQAIVDKLCIGKQRVDVVAGNKYDASISARRNTSITQGKVVLQESDPLSFDNTVSFISGSRASMRILIIGDKKVNFTIVAALQASGNGLHNKIILKDEKELTYDELDSADIIFINGLRGPSTVLESFAANRATTDKAIVFCIEQSEEFLNINQRLVSKAFTNGSKIRNLEPQTPVVPILADTISELWRGFPKTRCDDVTVYRYSTGAPGNSVLKLSNGHALITDTLDNANRTWIIITTSIGITDDNNLYESGFYVPFIDRITRYARSSIRSSSQVWMAGYLARNPLSDSRNIASVFDED